MMRLLLVAILLGFPLLEALVLVRLADTLGWWILAWVVLAAVNFGLVMLPVASISWPGRAFNRATSSAIDQSSA